MPRYDFRTPRLFLEQPIEAGRSLELSRAQANYLVNVLRLADGKPVLLFNGRDGEWPVLTRHTQTRRVNLERMRANAIEAAEQCGILNLPQIGAPVALDEFVAGWTPTRLLVFCDEDAETADPVAALAPARSGGLMGALPVSLLVGPEGGFAEDERKALRELPNVIRLALGPRILRADTAAVAALALVQAVLGDWR